MAPIPLVQRLMVAAVIIFAALTTAFFLGLVPMVAMRDPKAAEALLATGIVIFALGILIMPALIVFIVFLKPKKKNLPRS